MNSASTNNAVTAFTDGILKHIAIGQIKDMHNIKLWRTAQLLIYNSSQERNLFAFTLTNKCHLIILTMDHITNCANSNLPMEGNLLKKGAFTPSPSNGCTATMHKVPHIYLLPVADYLAFMAPGPAQSSADQITIHNKIQLTLDHSTQLALNNNTYTNRKLAGIFKDGTSTHSPAYTTPTNTYR